MKHPTIVVAGGLAQRSMYGGHAWVFLQYLIGFRRLGYEVLFVDRAESDRGATDPATRDGSRGVEGLVRGLDAIAPPIEHAVLVDGGRQVLGMTRAELLARVRRSVMLLNVMGFVDDAEILAAAPLAVFLDIDPGFPQMWRELGLADVFAGHDAFVSVGANIGRSDCTIPECGISWVATRPPVVLALWPPVPGRGRAVTTVASWRGPFAPVQYEGQVYGLRVHEFRRFAALPSRANARLVFELALDIDRADDADRRLLEREGWRLVDPRQVACDVERYRGYVQGSTAELMVAKGMYAQSRSGWFSDRSACYLASGRPVVAQDTGLSELYPCGAGLLTFSTIDEAAERVEAIDADYPRHARAARELAAEHFDSDRVLGALLDDLGVSRA